MVAWAENGTKLSRNPGKAALLNYEPTRRIDFIGGGRPSSDGYMEPSSEEKSPLFLRPLKTRLGAQAEDSKSLAARTVTGVSRRAFLNASQASKSLAPQGVLSKLGESIGSRFRNASSSPEVAAAVAGATPTPLELAGGGGGGDAAVNDSRDASQETPSAASKASPKGLAKLVAGMRNGKDQPAAGAAGAAEAAEAVSSPCPSSSPPLSERAVKGVLGRVFTGSQKTASGGDVAQESAVTRAGVADGKPGRKGGGSGVSTPPAKMDAAPTKEPLRGARKTGAQVTAAVTPAVATKAPRPASTAAPEVRSKVDRTSRTAAAAAAGVADSSPEKRAQQQGGASGKAQQERGHPERSRQSRRRGHRSGDGAEEEEERHWQDVDLIGSGGDTASTLMDKIRAPLGKRLKIGGHDPRAERRDVSRAEAGGASKNGGAAPVVVAQPAAGSGVGDNSAEFEEPSKGDRGGFFRGRFSKARGRSGSAAAVRDASLSDTLDEIGLGG